MSKPWQRPAPNPALMAALGIVNRWFLLRGVPGLRSIPVLRDLPLGRGYFWVRELSVPSADLARLGAAVNADTVAFLAPNHPEFGTDWMIDKEISTLVSPRMASWADRGIVAAAPKFWGMNNLVANDGADAARDYSVEWAMRGEGVLLHPEGSVWWTNDIVQPLFPGIAQMAISAAAKSEKPVFIVPLVWKYHYVGDVSSRLHREISLIERALKLESTKGDALATRFGKLQWNALEVQARRFGFTERGEGTFFNEQAAFQDWLTAELESRHTIERSDDVFKRVARLAKAIRGQLREMKKRNDVFDRKDALEHDLRMADEAKRLGEFTAAAYGSPMLTQEQIGESLKRMRDRLVRGGWKNALANTLPRPMGPRVVHVGVPEPIRVVADADLDALLEITRGRMQARLDQINASIADDVKRFAVVNELSPMSSRAERSERGICR